MLVLSAHIIVATMEILDMESITDTPSEILIPPDILKKSNDERKEVMDHVVGIIIDTFVDISTVKFKTPQTPPNSDTESNQVPQNTNSDDEGEDIEEEMEGESGAGEVEEVSTGDDGKTPNKDFFRYACELVTFGLLLYSAYSDTIKENDGPREFHCFKYILPMF